MRGRTAYRAYGQRDRDVERKDNLQSLRTERQRQWEEGQPTEPTDRETETVRGGQPTEPTDRETETVRGRTTYRAYGQRDRDSERKDSLQSLRTERDRDNEREDSLQSLRTERQRL